MAKIDFDDPNVPVTHTVDFDQMTPEQITAMFGTDAKSGERLAALTAAMAGVAHDQATLNKLVAAAFTLGTKALAGAAMSPASVLASLG